MSLRKEVDFSRRLKFGIVTSEVNGGTNSSLGGSEGERLFFFGGKLIF
jgi:hypothetical protein